MREEKVIVTMFEYESLKKIIANIIITDPYTDKINKSIKTYLEYWFPDPNAERFDIQTSSFLQSLIKRWILEGLVHTS